MEEDTTGGPAGEGGETPREEEEDTQRGSDPAESKTQERLPAMDVKAILGADIIKYCTLCPRDHTTHTWGECDGCAHMNLSVANRATLEGYVSHLTSLEEPLALGGGSENDPVHAPFRPRVTMAVQHLMATGQLCGQHCTWLPNGVDPEGKLILCTACRAIF